MADWLSLRWHFFRHLLFPSSVLLGLFLGIAALSLWVGLLGYAAGRPELLRVAGLFLLAIFTVNLMQMPVQLNQLLGSRAWVLCPGAVRRPLQVGMVVLAVWAMALAFALDPGASAWAWLSMAAFCWALASLAVVLGAWQQLGFVAFMMGLVLIAWPDGLSVALPLSDGKMGLALLWPLVWLGAGLFVWWQLARFARQGKVKNSELSWESGPLLQSDRLGGRWIQVSDQAFERFAQTATLSSHPFLRPLSISALALLVVMALLLAERYWAGESLRALFFSVEPFGSFVVGIPIVAGSSALTAIQAIYRRLPVLWLVLDGDRTRLYAYLVRTQWGLFLAIFVPVGILGAWLSLQMGIPFWRIMLAGLGTVLIASLGLYWGNSSVGSDNPWMGLVGMVVMLPALLLVAWAGLAMPLPAVILVFSVVGLISAFLRRQAQRRWQTLDLGDLRSLRSW